MDQRTLLLQRLADREAAAVEQVTVNAERSIAALWTGFAAWYSTQQIAALAQQSIAIQQAARVQVGNLGVAYMREAIAVLRAARVPAVRLNLPPARLGADITGVYSRPASAYQIAFSLTGDADEALGAALERSSRLITADLVVARRDGEHQQMVAAGVKRYRRIVHPERSETGVCGLCLAASDRVYKVAELMPIHDRCKCTTAEITDDYDPGEANQVDLDAIYAAAGGTTDGRALKEVRFQVNQHGELGPVLTRHGDRFQRRGDAPKGDPIERARKELDALLPVLEGLERRAAAGEDVTAPLGYQRNRIAKLTAITRAA